MRGRLDIFRGKRLWVSKSFLCLKKKVTTIIATHNYYVPSGSRFYHSNVTYSFFKKIAALNIYFKAVSRPD